MKDDLKKSLKHAISKAPPPKKTKYPGAIAILSVILLAATVLIYHLTPQQPAASNLGKITSPLNGSTTSRTIKINGYTENIPPELPYIVIAVDVEKHRLSWPKQPFITPNTKFQTSFHEGGPAGPCKVSLYAVNSDFHKKITQWLKEERFGGMPQLPDRFKLDTISLMIN